MADFEDDGGSFTLVEDSHRGKKHKVSEQEPTILTTVMKRPRASRFKQTQLLVQKSR